VKAPGFATLTRWRSERKSRRSVTEAYEELTPPMVDHILSTMGDHVSRVLNGGPGRSADLPFPQALIEVAFVKAMHDLPEGERLELVKGLYVRLDDYLLTDADHRALKAWDTVIREGREVFESELFQASDEASRRDIILKHASLLGTADAARANDVRAALGEKAQRRKAAIDAIVVMRARGPAHYGRHLVGVGFFVVWVLVWGFCLITWWARGFAGGADGLFATIESVSGALSGLASEVLRIGVILFLVLPIIAVAGALAWLLLIAPFALGVVGIAALWRRIVTRTSAPR